MSYIEGSSSNVKQHMGQFDGASDDPRQGQRIGGLLDVPASPVEQVHLKGPTIVQAWISNPITRQLNQAKSKADSYQRDPANLGSSWTPATSGNNFVYHGSAISKEQLDEGWTQKFNNTPFDALGPQSNPSQMTFKIPVIYTAFSALRSFLWAAFKRGLNSMSPDPQEITDANIMWPCGGRMFTGIVLFQFSATQPAPAGYSYHIIPEHQVKGWGKLSLDNAGDNKTDNADIWSKYDKYHKQTGPRQWPDIVHGVEYGEQETALSPFKVNMWRTIWKGDRASDHLKSNHRATFAITFEVGPAEPAAKGESSTKKPPPKDGDDDDDQPKGKKKKDRFKTLRGLKQKASGSDLAQKFRAWSNRSTD